MKIEGCHILITGGAKRLGRFIAENLLSQGGRITLHYRTSQTEAEDFVATAKLRGGQAQSVYADLSQVETIRTAVKTAEKHFGGVDILINSASLFFPKTALETTSDEWDLLHHANVKGHFFFAQSVAPSMLAQKRGIIINLVDVAATIGAKNYTAYATAKAGLLLLTKNLAKEWAPAIRVNSISPGPVLEPEDYSEAQKEASIRRTLMKRWGTPNDIVAAVNFLIGNDYVTGFDLKVDGGRSLV